MKSLKHLIPVLTSCLLGMSAVIPAISHAAQEVRVYGPGGPAPAMKEAAKTFEENTSNSYRWPHTKMDSKRKRRCSHYLERI